MSYLLLIRHGLSTYNKAGIWTGWDDPDLAPEGVVEAQQAALTLRDLPMDLGYTSIQKRHIQTLDIVKKALNKDTLPIVENIALNERDYGTFTRKNKWQVKKEVGDEIFQKMRRGWDYPIPEGESLKQVYDRVVKYYQSTIFPELKLGKNVIISSSGNALRSLVKYLEKISDEDISNLEIATGEVYVYQLDEKGNILNKEIRNQHPNIA
ncbi:MAG: 2,3-bisphosphoglycerate-dependent phosphoglycerate mutase [bacterium]|nr:2,3-bisphosphoglycerate-dependent phosphoglycerate mutase [bacterium]